MQANARKGALFVVRFRAPHVASELTLPCKVTATT